MRRVLRGYQMKLTEVQNLRSELQKWRLEILRGLIFLCFQSKNYLRRYVF